MTVVSVFWGKKSCMSEKQLILAEGNSGLVGWLSSWLQLANDAKNKKPDFRATCSKISCLQSEDCYSVL